jgi:hypothetical protein
MSAPKQWERLAGEALADAGEWKRRAQAAELRQRELEVQLQDAEAADVLESSRADEWEQRCEALERALEEIAKAAQSLGAVGPLHPHKADMRSIARKARAVLAEYDSRNER